ncbi:excalibur calcium-binding domain-containing protein [Ruegeria pomeroyi]|nr:excalibur calcium-binding domain-containing protein [Ruegeria pomeroyi]
MTELQAIREALYPETSRKPTRRQRRAERTRAKALSPLRILLLLASLPVIAGSTAFGVYIRTSPYPPELALRHIAALAGCEVAALAGLPEARRGEPGYHLRNDADLDGVACGTTLASASMVPQVPVQHAPGQAKFVRP